MVEIQTWGWRNLHTLSSLSLSTMVQTVMLAWVVSVDDTACSASVIYSTGWSTHSPVHSTAQTKENQKKKKKRLATAYHQRFVILNLNTSKQTWIYSIAIHDSHSSLYAIIQVQHPNAILSQQTQQGSSTDGHMTVNIHMSVITSQIKRKYIFWKCVPLQIRQVSMHKRDWADERCEEKGRGERLGSVLCVCVCGRGGGVTNKMLKVISPQQKSPASIESCTDSVDHQPIHDHFTASVRKHAVCLHKPTSVIRHTLHPTRQQQIKKRNRTTNQNPNRWDPQKWKAKKIQTCSKCL